jgi:hypothetical protein
MVPFLVLFGCWSVRRDVAEGQAGCAGSGIRLMNS